MTTVDNTDSLSGEGNGKITLLLYTTSKDLMETYAKEELLVVTYSTEKELTVTMTTSMVVGSKLLMSKIYMLMKVMMK